MAELFDFEGYIRELAQRCGVDVSQLPADDEVRRLEYEEKVSIINTYIDKKFGVEFEKINNYHDLGMPEKLISSLDKFLDSSKTFLLLKGSTGTAKTAIAKIIFSKILFSLFKKSGSELYAINNVQYIRALDFFDQVKKCYNDSDSLTQLIEYTSQMKLLVIDEVGATFGTHHEVIQFNRLVDNFYRTATGKLILITNIEDTIKLSEYISAPAISRISQSDRGTIINFQNADFRKKDTQELFF